jgi:hemolysin D
MTAASNVVRLPAKPDRDADEIAFLPAALEIVEKPPSPVGRAIVFTIVAVACLAAAWAAFGTIDIVASAQGKIIPVGRTKVIQPFETSVVRAIRVQDGQRVRAGDVLIALDPTINEAEASHLRSDLIAARLDEARLRAALTDGDPLDAFTPPEGAKPADVATARQFLVNQVGEHRAKLAVLDRQRAQKEAEAATISATIAKIEALIPVIQQRVDIRKALYNTEFGSKIQYLEQLQMLVEQQHELVVQKSKLREAEAAAATVAETRAQTVAEYRRTILDELAKATQKAAGLAQDLVKAATKAQYQELTSPIDGVVQQLAVHTVGGVVTPAQQLLSIVPFGSPLEIEAMVLNRDIGFVQPGQEVEVKVDAFNFTRYGLLHGKVLSISHDAIVRDKPQDKPNDQGQGMPASTSEPKGQELLYAARVSMDRSQMLIDGKLVDLAPGMAVTAEVKTGTRTVLSYVLSPLVKYRQESLRER